MFYSKVQLQSVEICNEQERFEREVKAFCLCKRAILSPVCKRFLEDLVYKRVNFNLFFIYFFTNFYSKVKVFKRVNL
jgi:hypothetical protein